MRDAIRRIQAELRSGDLTPEDARQHLVTLTALLGNCLEELRHAETAYNQVLLRELEADGPANRAKIRAAITPEHGRREEARNARELVTEMIRSLKVMLRSLEEEMRLTR